MENTFGLKKTSGTIDKLVRTHEWVAINLQNIFIAGSLKEITQDGFVVVNPYQSCNYLKPVGERYILSNEGRGKLVHIILLTNNGVISPTSEAELNSYCCEMNQKELEEKRKQDGKK